MPDESIFASDVIGRAADLNPDLKPEPAPAKQPVHPLASLEELRKPSPEPHLGRPDPDYPDLYTNDPLYSARFLLRRWGEERFVRSAFYSGWKAAAERTVSTFAPDLKPSDKKR